jgi:hypothetical protein
MLKLAYDLAVSPIEIGPRSVFVYASSVSPLLRWREIAKDHLTVLLDSARWSPTSNPGNVAHALLKIADPSFAHCTVIFAQP